MELITVDHPLVAHKLSLLRSADTDAPTFRQLTDELVGLLAYEATRQLATEVIELQTPLGEARGLRLCRPRAIVVPVLRAGIGMLDAMCRVLPTAGVGFIGLVRDETDLTARTYTTRLPARLDGRVVFLLDPMLATGGTLESVVAEVVGRGATSVTVICLLASPVGLARLNAGFPGPVPALRVVVAAVDPELDARGYIRPGLGDAGDRLYGAL